MTATITPRVLTVVTPFLYVNNKQASQKAGAVSDETKAKVENEPLACLVAHSPRLRQTDRASGLRNSVLPSIDDQETTSDTGYRQHMREPQAEGVGPSSEQDIDTEKTAVSSLSSRHAKKVGVDSQLRPNSHRLSYKAMTMRAECPLPALSYLPILSAP